MCVCVCVCGAVCGCLRYSNSKNGQFALSAASDPTDYSQWEFMDVNTFSMPGGFGACPSIRYDPATGYYYVLTGGNSISVLRSLDLQKWEVRGRGGGQRAG